MQTTLLGLAIAFIIALVAALIGPHFIDWNQFRPQFEAEASQVIGAPVRVAGELDARLLPSPSLRLHSVTVGGVNDLGKIRADKLDVEFSLGDLMRGQWRATELTIDGLSLDLGLDPQGRVDWPATSGKFNLGSLAIDRLNLTGRVALHDASSRGTLELSDITFSGDVRSLAGSVRGDGGFSVAGTRYPFRVSSGQNADGSGTRLHVNIDPGARPFSAELDGVLAFEARAPRFEGTLTLAAPAPAKSKDGDAPPWRISSRVKTDHAAATLDQLEASYGADERALKFSGQGDVRFGAAPLLRASLSARQLDADKLSARDPGAGNGAAEPARWLPRLRGLAAQLPHLPLSSRIEFAVEQIMLGGRPLQNVALNLRGNAESWMIERLDLRAPGATHVAFDSAATSAAATFTGALDVSSSDPDVLVGWLQGRGDIARRGQKPLRLRGDVSVAPDRLAIERLKAEIDGGALEGRMALVNLPPTGGSSRLEAGLKAESLDLDAATAFARLLAGPPADWPDEANVSLDIARAKSSGQELRSFTANFGYTARTFSLDRLQFGQAGGMMLESAGRFDRMDATGKLALAASGASLAQVAALASPFAPEVAARLEAAGAAPGPARVKLDLELGKSAEAADRAAARAVLDLDAPQFKGSMTFTARPELAAIRSFDLDRLGRGEIGVHTRLSAPRGEPLLALLGLDHAVAAGDGTVQFEATLGGVWRAPLRLDAKMWGGGIDAEAQGSLEPWTADPKANVNLRIRSIDLAPLFGLKAHDATVQNLRLFSRVSLLGRQLKFDDLDGVTSTSRLRGHLAVTLDEDKQVDGEVGLDSLDLAPAFLLAIGATGRDEAEPLGAGLLKGWRGRIAFQALRGALPGGDGELRPVSGTVRNDGQALHLDAIKGGIGGGQATATIEARPGADGLAVNGRLELTGVDGKALRYRGLAMPSGRASLQMALSSQGRSISALAGALSGNGTMTLEAAGIPGLDARAFDAAIRFNDSGQATDEAKLRKIVEPILSAGSLPVAAAQIPFTIRDGRLRVGATTLDAEGARAIVSGGYDFPADQADIRVSLISQATGPANSHPEIQMFATGTPDALNRTLDITSLSSWLAVRTIDRETRRLDAIERGEPPPSISPLVPPSTAALPAPDQPLSDVPLPGRDPRRFPLRPKPAPRLPLNVPASVPPVASQQAAPLPPPIEVRPAPGPAPVAKPKPRPPMVLTSPPGNP